jgi:putative aldouronate transport system permease protein
MAVAGNVFQGDQMQVGETIKYATIIIATVPILCVYPFLQKYFVKGVMIGAVKG